MLRKKPAYLVLGIVLVLQVARSWVFFSYENNDRNRQVRQASHWVAQGTLSLVEIDPEDWAKDVAKPPYPWPPAYPLLVAGMYQLLGDWFAAVEWLHLLSLVLTICGIVYAWQWVAPIPLDQVSLSWAIAWGLNFSPFAYLGTTDLLAGGCWLWSLILLTKGFEAPKGQRAWFLLTHVMCLSLSIWMRYAYLPLALVPCAYLGMHVYKEKRLIDVLTILLIGGSALGVLWYQQMVAGASEISLQSADRWIYLDHLLDFDPFIIKNFWYVSAPKLASMLRVPAAALTAALWLLSMGILFWYRWRGRSVSKLPSLIKFLLYGGIITVALLVGLSLVTPAEVWDDGTIWTYVSETRYFFPVALLLMVGGWYFLRQLPAKGGRRQLWLMIWMLGGVVAIGHSASRWVGLGAGELRNGRGSQFERDLRTTAACIEQERRAGYPVRFVHGNWYEYAEEQTVAQWAGASSISFEESKANSVMLSDTIMLLGNLKPEEWKAFSARIQPFLIHPPDTISGVRPNGEAMYRAVLAPKVPPQP